MNTREPTCATSPSSVFEDAAPIGCNASAGLAKGNLESTVPERRPMRTWTGKLYFFQGDDGQQYVTAASPTARGIDALKVHAYRVTGPFIPVGWSKTVAVRDSAQWLAELQKLDFICEPCVVD